MRTRARAMLGLAAFVACGPVAGAPPSPAPINACPDHPCEAYRPFTPGGADAQCSAGSCEVNAKIDYTLVVSLPDTSFYGPGLSFAIPFASLFQGATDKCPARSCAQLPRVAAASGYYQPTRSVQDPPDASPGGVGYFVGQNVVLPVHASYVPLASLGGGLPTDATTFGLPLATTVGDVTFALGGIPGPGGGPSAGFYAVLPPGLYERRIMPDPPFDAAFPPDVSIVTLAPGVSFDRDILNALDKVGQATIPSVTLSRDDGGSLDGWSAYLRDQSSLRRLSAIANVGPGNAIGAGSYHVFLFTNHHPPAVAGVANPLIGTELVVVPPRDVDAMPTLVTPALAGVLEQAAYPTIPAPASVRGSVTSTVDSVPLAADIVFTSTKIYLTTSSPSFTTNLTYTTRVSTDVPATQGDATPTDARYAVRLPRGEYDVVVSPRDPAFAKKAFQLIVDVENDPQDGKNLEVDRKRVLAGTALVTDGRPLASAEIEASPAASLLDGSTPASHWPRAATTTADLAGNFSLALDPGTYDITVRPAPGSRLPWVVSASRVVGASDARLDPIEIPAPIPAGLLLVDPSTNPVIGAIVRVFAVPTGGTAFVEIGRAMTDAAGHYDMPLAGAPH